MEDDVANTVEMRAGEEVPVAELLAWLRLQPAAEIPAHATCTVRQFPAGFSNLTYLVTVAASGVSWRYVLRRPPRGVASGVAHDMKREHGILAALHPLGMPVPRPIARCDDASVIGAPFYVMEFVEGIILRDTLPGVPASMQATVMPKLSETFVSSLVQLHSVDVTREPLASLGKPDGYVTRQVHGWAKRWHASKTDDIPDLDAIAQWLDEHQPSEQTTTLVHNDFKLDNLVLELRPHPRVKAILDWEMATIGDPLTDLGTSLAYWVEAGDDPLFRSLGLGVTALPGAMSRAEVVQAYARMSGRDVGQIAFYHAFGLFKLAIIAQQIYARHVRGLTADPRFGRLLPVIRALGAQALETARSAR